MVHSVAAQLIFPLQFLMCAVYVYFCMRASMWRVQKGGPRELKVLRQPKQNAKRTLRPQEHTPNSAVYTSSTFLVYTVCSSSHCTASSHCSRCGGGRGLGGWAGGCARACVRGCVVGVGWGAVGQGQNAGGQALVAIVAQLYLAYSSHITGKHAQHGSVLVHPAQANPAGAQGGPAHEHRVLAGHTAVVPTNLSTSPGSPTRASPSKATGPTQMHPPASPPTPPHHPPMPG